MDTGHIVGIIYVLSYLMVLTLEEIWLPILPYCVGLVEILAIWAGDV